MLNSDFQRRFAGDLSFCELLIQEALLLDNFVKILLNNFKADEESEDNTEIGLDFETSDYDSDDYDYSTSSSYVSSSQETSIPNSQTYTNTTPKYDYKNSSDLFSDFLNLLGWVLKAIGVLFLLAIAFIILYNIYNFIVYMFENGVFKTLKEILFWGVLIFFALLVVLNKK